MATTPLGWKVERPGSRNLVSVKVAGHTYTVKKGKGGWIANAMQYHIAQLNKIEALNEPGWDGTYNYRNARGYSTWSEHSAGTAFDHNASQHPMGYSRYTGFSAEHIRALNNYYRNDPIGKLFRWGAHYTHRKDPMHSEMLSPATWNKHRKATIKFLKSKGYKAR